MALISVMMMMMPLVNYNDDNVNRSAGTEVKKRTEKIPIFFVFVIVDNNLSGVSLGKIIKFPQNVFTC